MKKRVLFVVHHLTIGGVQKSLVSALHAMNYDKYDIDLYLQKNRTVLLPFIDKRVNVIINEDKRHYYRFLRSILLEIIIKVCNVLKLKEKEKYYRKKLADYINSKAMSYAKRVYFKNQKYDVAVAYNACYEALFVSEYINAERKLVCFQSSTIELPDMQPTVLPKFDRIVVEDISIKEMLREEIPKLEGKITVIENYVDTDFIKEQANISGIDIVKKKVTLCSVGRQAYIKGFDIAVDAAKLLKEKGIDYVWYFVGDGPENEKLKKAIEENDLQNEVILTGMQTNPYPYIKACDIFVQPSREEAMSIAALESQVLLKPLVTTETVGGKNICKDGETGIITEISAEGIADGIMKLINSPEIMNKITENLKKTDYSVEKERYKRQWDQVLEGI